MNISTPGMTAFFCSFARFSSVVSSGNELDLEALDYVEHLVAEPHTRVIMLFLEGFRNGRRFPAGCARAGR